MQTVLEVLQRTTEWFAGKGIEAPRADAERLLAEGLGVKRLDLYLMFDRPLEEAELEKVRPLVKRRGQGEPTQYILGEWDFLDLTLKTDARALIPRPETEELAEQLVTQLKSTPPAHILDLGTGTGALALGLASAFPQAQVTATDRSADALALARENAEKCGLVDRVTFLEGSWFEPVSGTFDLIVSNPPYLTLDEWEQAAPHVREHEPREALVAENAGIDDLANILEQAPAFLNANGLLALETGIAHHEALAAKAEASGFSRWEGRKDASGRPRFFIAWR